MRESERIMTPANPGVPNLAFGNPPGIKLGFEFVALFLPSEGSFTSSLQTYLFSGCGTSGTNASIEFALVSTASIAAFSSGVMVLPAAIAAARA